MRSSSRAMLVSALLVALSAGAVARQSAIHDLALPGHEFGSARHVNDQGQVLHWSALDAATPELGTWLWSAAGGHVAVAPVFGHDRILPYGVNGAGQVLGLAFSTDGSIPGNVSFLWTAAGGAVDLDVFGYYGQPNALNELGHAVGVTNVPADGFFLPRGWLWTPATGAVDLGDLGGGRAVANDLNDLGQVVGFSDVEPWTPGGGSDARAVLWEPDGSIVELGQLDGAPTRALAINDAGQVFGLAQAPGVTRAFYWSPETGMLDLGTLGGFSTWAAAINDLGQVVGWSQTETFSEHAFVWTPAEGMVDLGALGSSSQAHAINDYGQIVGESSTWSGEVHAVLWSAETGLVDLGALPPPFTHSRAFAINNSGLAAGESSYMVAGVGWVYHPVAWEIPVPDPTPEQQLEAIAQDLSQLAADGALEPGEVEALGATLSAAMHSLENGNLVAAANALRAFQNQVQAKINAGILSEAEGQALIEAAEQVTF